MTNFSLDSLLALTMISVTLNYIGIKFSLRHDYIENIVHS